VVAGEVPGSRALLGERWDGLPDQGSVPAKVWAEAHWALVSYPQVALLPARYAVAEISAGGSSWQTMTAATISPQAARDTLATYLAQAGPQAASAGDHVLGAAYAAAATILEHQRPASLKVAGRHFQVIRVEQIIRLCHDGPEPPRTCDYDPDPPAEAGSTGPPWAG
jgi:Family of unknown function (DUF5954)